MELLSAWVLYCNMIGVPLRTVLFSSLLSVIKDLRMITTVTPAGPIFFCAPAKIKPYRFTSQGSDKMQEDISATKGTLPVSGSSVKRVP